MAEKPAAVAFQQVRRQLELDALVSADRPDTQRIGVVFVHGVGSQPQSATVREFGQPLVDWLREWHDHRDDDAGWD